jgi:hypothetical protein
VSLRLSLLIAAFLLLGIPVKDSILSELDRVYRAAHVAVTVHFSEFDISSCQRDVPPIHRYARRLDLPSFGFSFRAISTSYVELIKDFRSAAGYPSVPGVICDLKWRRVAHGRGICGINFDSHHEKNETSIRRESPKETVRDSSSFGCGEQGYRFDFINLHHMKSCLTPPFLGKVRSERPPVRISGKLSRKSMSLVDSIPAGRVASAAPSASSSHYEDRPFAKCGDLAVFIIWSSADVSPLAIGSHDDLVVRPVDHPNGTLFDLGRCGKDTDGNQQEDSFHLVAKSNETSISFSTVDHSLVLNNWEIFATWNEVEWYQLATAKSR